MISPSRSAHSARPFRVAVTADLHYGTRHADGLAATHAVVDDLAHDPPDLLLIAGDVGAGDEFSRCLERFDQVPCRKALVPGNHDVWVRSDDVRGDSTTVYREHLPRIADEHHFEYLDHGPIILPEHDLAVVGSMNWYDYSWAVDRLRAVAPDWSARLRSKRFSRGRHNDANFVRWEHSDESFTTACVDQLARHLSAAFAKVRSVIVVTHHPPFRDLNYPKPEPMDLDALMWEAFSGNARVEAMLARYTDRIPLVFCGHTHFARQGAVRSTRAYNVGGDYHFKRLLRFDWPAPVVRAFDFGEAGERVA